MSKGWTKEQMLAITEEGTNIIVSAGAGSGKTAVLTERIVRKLRNGISIDQLIVVTFTKAAANEMKERIRNKIKEEPAIQSNLDKLDSAYITTFDSLALSIVRKYHYLLNVSKDVSICESSVLELEKRRIIDDIFEDRYQLEDANFLHMIEDLCLKDDKDLRRYVLSMNNKLDMRYDKRNYLTNYIQNSFSEQKIDRDLEEYFKLLKKRCLLLGEQLDQLRSFVDETYYIKMEDALFKLIHIKTYDLLYRELQVIKVPALPKESDEQAASIKKEITSIVKELKGLCSYQEVSGIKNSIYMTHDYIEAMISIILELDERIHVYKFSKDVYEFVDIFKMAIEILENNEDVRNEMKDSIHEILVDEYQDTNDLGELLLSYISNHNVYMVGDVKQSIYRFRNANPYIFKRKYDAYRNFEDGKKIDLNKNFRSREEVLHNINLIFDLIMDDTIGGANYQAEHQMEFGNMLYETTGKVKHDHNLEIYSYQYDKEQDFTRAEIEAFIIVKDIKEKVDSGYLIFDKDVEEIRPIHYSDFVILIDRTTSFDLYKKIFTYLQVPLLLYRDELITDSLSVLLLKNLLIVLECQNSGKFDVSYEHACVSILRSMIYEEIDDSTIFSLVTERKLRDTLLYQQIKELAKDIDTKSVSEIIQEVIVEFSLYEQLIKMGNVNQEMNALENMKVLAENLSDLGYTLHEFNDYMKEVFGSGSDLRISLSQIEGDAVKIMTIHKSKGLEFPVCYYAGCSSRFNKQDLKERFLYDSSYGLIAPYFKKGIRTTIYKELLKEKYNQEEISEKLRLFYVALTRSKEKMIIVADLSDEQISTCESNGMVSSILRSRYNSFMDILLSVKDQLKVYLRDIALMDVGLTKDYNLIKGRNYKDQLREGTLTFHKKELHINVKETEEHRYSKQSHTLLDIKTKRNLDEGIRFHYLLELLDLKQPNLGLLSLSPFQRQKLEAFLNTPLLKTVEQATIFKEYEFYYQTEREDRHGIIDLVLEYDDRVVIVDYKLNSVRDKHYVDQLTGYQEYIEQKTGKSVDIYLYSILDETEYKLNEK